VNDRTAASYYFGKRVAYIYKTHSGKAENRFRVYLQKYRPFGAEFREVTETAVPFWPDSQLTFPRELLDRPLE